MNHTPYNDAIGVALAAQSPLIVDGAMATELEKRGVNTANALWSATALIDHPQAIHDVHLSYFEAGANIATTDTYQANVPAFERLGLSQADAERLVARAAEEATAARDEYRRAQRLRTHCDKTAEPCGRKPTEERTAPPSPPLPPAPPTSPPTSMPSATPAADRPLLIAGSIGPYGAFLADGSEYTGDYELTDSEYRDFHRPRMRALADAGVDLFAFETMPNISEIRALTGLLAEEFPDMQAWMSFSLRDAEHLCDGTDLGVAAEIAQASQIGAVGINCVPLDMAEDAVHRLHESTDKPIIVYPNNGDVYHPETKTWTPHPTGLSLAGLAPRWVEAGASLIGGCCRTTPDDIRAVALAVSGPAAKHE
ncbi:homocysteine methyltransferase [Bifidobacterium margollesii]|uniref:Homocysteine methyltransferase n=2 Tax=Bifidobacterium margollesii TaxID=2020964 RepID=A0A2N5J9D0_9BIFI|nr:homocysteine methyltransferase [Bifidobacterium margollesii]